MKKLKVKEVTKTLTNIRKRYDINDNYRNASFSNDWSFYTNFK